MGTSWQVTLPRCENRSDMSAVQQKISDKLEQIESQMSHWRVDSLVSQFNQNRSTEPSQITRELATVIREAQRIHRLSKGAFDITSATLVDLWGFGPSGRQPGIPTDEQIQTCLADVDSALLVVSETTTNTFMLTKQHPDVQIDLSALAKGYAIDVVAECLNAQSFESYLIELGGELRARGNNHWGKPWQVGLEQPDSQTIGRIRRTVALRDRAIATSGSYRNFTRDADESAVTYTHILDPRSGRPVSHGLVSVSVIEATALRADALATALMVLGPQQGYELAVQENVAATFVSRSQEGLVERSTPALIAEINGERGTSVP
ncbi:MAG: FAD:protein FMN transferase [Planctomycetota bacterium]|nr:FAD:protein FMN transferase [Planctomycetota bacterium]